MAAFGESGIYLKFGEKPNGNARAVLWPVWVHRVLYPEVTRARLNLFQRAVLGLIRAKVVRAETIAELTNLHKDLVKLILIQGISDGWLGANADALTPQGLRVLLDEEDASANLKSGYLFQDALSGELWPRFEAQLKDIVPTETRASFPTFVMNRKTGLSNTPFLLRPNQRVQPACSAPALMKAYRDYRADYRATLQLYGKADLPEQIKMQGIERQDARAQLAHVLIWVTPNLDGGQLWSIKDPFDMRDQAWWMDSRLLPLVKANQGLLKYLSSLVEAPRGNEQSVEQWLADLQKQADLRVLTEFPWVERQPDVKRYLAALLSRQEKLAQGDAAENELEAAMTECQKLLEVVMQWLIGTFPVDAAATLKGELRADYRLKRKILMSFRLPAFNAEVIEQLAYQRLDQVIWACTSPSSSLKALLFAAGWGASSHPRHPLRTLSEEQLQLEQLLALATLRNQGSHAHSKFTGKKITRVTVLMAQQYIRYALGFTERFKEWM
ncbi:hypothetical protein GIV19_04705 [Pseudomonas syringae]|uniref:hypothetical protein n=1 Tax=Pseudomonas syringae TaxID=317 RepID=UPI001F32C01E|nr:hypothetical protein [Pseudomonas syringae]MCF5706586.1 hypothetical protein [Pseudomonas syringae]